MHRYYFVTGLSRELHSCMDEGSLHKAHYLADVEKDQVHLSVHAQYQSQCITLLQQPREKDIIAWD